MSRLIGEARDRAIQNDNEAQKRARTEAEFDETMRELGEAEERAKLPWGGGYPEQERIRRLRVELENMRNEELGEPEYPMEDY